MTTEFSFILVARHSITGSVDILISVFRSSNSSKVMIFIHLGSSLDALYCEVWVPKDKSANNSMRLGLFFFLMMGSSLSSSIFILMCFFKRAIRLEAIKLYGGVEMAFRQRFRTVNCALEAFNYAAGNIAQGVFSTKTHSFVHVCHKFFYRSYLLIWPTTNYSSIGNMELLIDLYCYIMQPMRKGVMP